MMTVIYFALDIFLVVAMQIHRRKRSPIAAAAWSFTHAALTSVLRF